MRIKVISVACGLMTVLSVGCEVRYREPVAEVSVETPAPEVEVGGPVIEGPGVEVITVEPDPVERVYVYEPGYPPGTYFYGGFYWYDGYRYSHDVFIHRYVDVNIRERRFIDVEANRRRGVVIERSHRDEFARGHGRRVAPEGRDSRKRSERE
jgi:hypothetical protein